MAQRGGVLGGSAFRVVFVLASVLGLFVASQASLPAPAFAQSTSPPPPPLQVTIKDDQDPVRVGETMTYSITARNTSSSTVNNVKVRFSVPKGTTFVSTNVTYYNYSYNQPSCSQADGVVTCAIPRLDAKAYTSDGRSSYSSFDVKVRPSTGAGVLTGEVSAAADGVAEVAASEQTTVEEKPLLALDVTDDQDPVRVGETVTYSMKISNTADELVSNAKASFPVPEGTSFVSVAPTHYNYSYNQPSCSQADGAVTCTVPRLDTKAYTSDGRSSYVTVAVKVRPTRAGAVDVAARVKDDWGLSVSASQTVVVEEKPLLDLTVTDDQDPVRAGETIAYSVKVANTADEGVTNAEAKFSIPVGTTFVSTTVTHYNYSYNQPTCSRTDQVVTCTIPRLDTKSYTSDGRSSYVTFEVKAKASAGAGTVTASADAKDEWGIKTSATQATVVEDKPLVGLSISHDQDPVKVGETVAYTVKAANTADEPINDVKVTFPVPENTNFVSVAPSYHYYSQGRSVCSQADRVVSCTIQRLETAGQTSSYSTFDVRVRTTRAAVENVAEPSTSPSGVRTGAVTAKAEGKDAIGVSGSAVPRQTIVEERPLVLAVLSEDQDPVRVGETITYSATARNVLDEEVVGSRVTFPVPDDTTFVSASPGCTQALGIVSCSATNIGVGGARTVNVSVRSTTPGAVTARMETTDEFGISNGASRKTTVEEKPLVDLSVSDDQDPVRLGETITYTVRARNAVDEEVSNVRLTAPVPAGTTFVSADAPCGRNGNIVSCAAGNISAGATRAYNIRVRTTAPGTATARAEANYNHGVPTKVAESTAVEEKSSLGLSISPDQDPARVGEAITYNVKVSNALDEDVSGIKMTFPVPAGTSFVSAYPDNYYWYYGNPCSQEAGTVTCTADSFGVGGSRIFRVTVRPEKAGNVAVKATANNTGGFQNEAARTTVVEEKSLIDLSMTDDKDPIGRGEVVTYRITARNTTDETLSAAWITMPVPANASFVSAAPSNYYYWQNNPCSLADGLVSCYAGDIGVGGSYAVNVAIKPTGPGTINAKAEADDQNGVPAKAAQDTLRVAPKPPVAADDTATTDEDAPLKTQNVLLNDKDPEGGAMTVSAFEQPKNGKADCTTVGVCTYTPNKDFNGEDSFVYTALDDEGGEASGTVKVSVKPVNDAPVAADDSAATDEDTPVDLSVRSNDSDPDGDALSASVVDGPANGKATKKPDGSFSYEPSADFSGDDSFTYKVSDGNGAESGVATVRISVGPVDDAPTISGLADRSTDEDSATGPVPFSVGDAETAAADLTVAASSDNPGLVPDGNVTVRGSGADRTVEVAPAKDKHGAANVTLVVKDGSGNATRKNFALDVKPVNDAPEAKDDASSTTNDKKAAVEVLGNDSDPDGDRLEVRGSTQGTNGAVSCAADGRCEYIPSAGFVGDDSFTYTVSDGQGGEATATVKVSVAAVPAPPPAPTPAPPAPAPAPPTPTPAPAPPNTAPKVANPAPAPGSTTRDRTPLVTATAKDAQGPLAKGNVHLYVDGKRVTAFSYDAVTGKLAYASKALVPGSRHSVRIVATDPKGLAGTLSWSFRVAR